MIDIRKLKELVRLMVSNDLTEVDLRDSEEQVTLKRNNQQFAPPLHVAMPSVSAAVASASSPSSSTSPTQSQMGGGGSSGSAGPGTDESAAGLVEIVSPMVGTFYAAPSPDKPPFVSVNGSVGPESVVCLIEAMKVFNEIKAECSGTIERVLVKSGESVEFGQRLFLVRPS